MRLIHRGQTPPPAARQSSAGNTDAEIIAAVFARWTLNDLRRAIVMGDIPDDLIAVLESELSKFTDLTVLTNDQVIAAVRPTHPHVALILDTSNGRAWMTRVQIRLLPAAGMQFIKGLFT